MVVATSAVFWHTKDMSEFNTRYRCTLSGSADGFCPLIKSARGFAKVPGSVETTTATDPALIFISAGVVHTFIPHTYTLPRTHDFRFSTNRNRCGTQKKSDLPVCRITHPFSCCLFPCGQFVAMRGFGLIFAGTVPGQWHMRYTLCKRLYTFTSYVYMVVSVGKFRHLTTACFEPSPVRQYGCSAAQQVCGAQSRKQHHTQQPPHTSIHS